MAATYAISPLLQLINEGQTLQTMIHTTGVINGTLLYWSLSGTNITAADFSAGALLGQARVVTVDGDTFGFRLTSLDATNGPGSVSITNFTAPGDPHHDDDPVSAPGPLPILGATAAFGWSRRLRRRHLVLN